MPVWFRTAKAKLVRLEKEAAECERAKEELRTASAKVAELDKSNKKLYAQAHADKKAIIKLNEVGSYVRAYMGGGGGGVDGIWSPCSEVLKQHHTWGVGCMQ